MVYYLDDTKITSGSQLIALIQEHEVGDKVTFTIVRNNELKKYSLVLEDSQDIQKQTEDADGSENQNGQNGQNGQQLPQQEPEQERGWFDIFPW